MGRLTLNVLLSFAQFEHIAERIRHASPGMVIASPQDAVRWVQATGQQPDAAGYVLATFVVDEAGSLRVADRHNEHVVCARCRHGES